MKAVGTFKGTLVGDKELTSALNWLGKKTEKKFIKRAVGAAGKVVSTSAKSNVRNLVGPGSAGMLEKSIGTKNILYKNSGSAVSVIGPRTNTSGKKRKVQGWAKKFDPNRKPSNYGHLVEFGTKPHWIPCKNVNGVIIWKAWLHPGTPARPFMRKAYDNNKGRSLDTMKESLHKDISAEAKKLAGKRPVTAASSGGK